MLIDSHHHWIPEWLVKNPEKVLWPEDSVKRQGDRVDICRHGFVVLPGLLREDFYSIERKLKAMDAAGVDLAVLGADGVLEWLTLEDCRMVNDELADVVSQHPDRFIGLAHVEPLAEGCPAELERAINQLGFKGVTIPTHIVREGLPLDSPRLDPFYRKVSELNVPIVVHPANLPPDYEMFRGYDIERTFGRAVSGTVATLRLLQSDVLERFPKLRFVMPHLGGTFFAIKDRAIASFLQFGGKPADFEVRLDRFYFDTAPPFWLKPHLDCALATLGPQRLVFGSDHPVGPDFIQRASAALQRWEFDKMTYQQVTEDNARALWGI